MNDILKLANLLIKSRRPPAPTDNLFSMWQNDNGFVHLCFQSRGCKNDLSGSCIMCDYGIGRNIDAEEICRAFDEAINSNQKEIHTLLLGTYGSFLDPFEMPFENLCALLEKVAKSDIQTIIIETHYNTVNIQMTSIISDILHEKDVVLEFGFESANQFIQKHCLNKKIDLGKLRNTIDLVHSFNFNVTLNVLLGTPFLSASEQLEDALASIEWAFNNTADTVVLFPMNIKPFTLLEYLYNQGRYKPISHWLFIELISRIDKSVINKISLSWYGNREIIYRGENKRTILPESCPKCCIRIMHFYQKFLVISSAKQREYLIEEIVHEEANCDCRSQMVQSLTEKASPLEQRVEEEYKYIKDNLLSLKNG